MEDMLQQYGFRKHRKVYYRIVDNEVMQFIGAIYISGSWWLKYSYHFIHIDMLDIYLDSILNGLVEFDINALIGKEEKCFRTKDEALNYLSTEHLDRLNELKCVKDYIILCEKGLIMSSGYVQSPSIDEYLYLKDYDNAEKLISKDIVNYDDSIVLHIIKPIISNDDKEYENCEISEVNKKDAFCFLNDIRNKKDFSEKYDKIYIENINYLNKKFKYSL